jgi:hypothetical protein
MQVTLGPMLSTTGSAATASGYALRNHWENQDPGTYPPPPAQRDVQVTWRCTTFYTDQSCSWLFIIQPVLGPILGTTGYTMGSGDALCNLWENQDTGTCPAPPAKQDAQVT